MKLLHLIVDIKIQILIAYIFSAFSLLAQESGSGCKVMIKEIADTYKGDCLDGLAEGKGTARGTDTYEGFFHKGLPEGKGTYTYQNGNVFSGEWKNGLKNGKGKFKYSLNGKTTTLSGYWVDNEYKGITPPDEEYRVTNLTGIEHYTIKKTGDQENSIQISFERAWDKYIPKDLEVTISSGYKLEQNLKIVILDYQLPVECALHFTIKIANTLKQCNLTFLILKPGKYEVFISNS